MAWAATAWQGLAAKAAAAEEGTATGRAAAAAARAVLAAAEGGTATGRAAAAAAKQLQAKQLQAVAMPDAVLERPAARSWGGSLAAAGPPLTLPHSDNRGRPTVSSEADAPQLSSSSTQRTKPSPSTLSSSPQRCGRRIREQPLDSSPGGSDSDDDALVAPPAKPSPLRLDSSLGSDSDEDAPVPAQRWWSSSSSGAASGRSARATSVPRLMAPPMDLIQHPAPPHQQQRQDDSLKASVMPQTLPSSSLSADSYGGTQQLSLPSSPLVSAGASSAAGVSSATSVFSAIASPAGVSSSAAEVSSAVSVIPRRWQLQLLSQFEERIAASPSTRPTADSTLHQPQQQQQAGGIPSSSSSSSPGLRPTLFSSPNSITSGRATGVAALHLQPQALATLCWCIGQLRLLPAPWVPELLLQAG